MLEELDDGLIEFGGANARVRPTRVGGDAVYVAAIRVPESLRGQGLATHLHQEVCRIADNQGVTLCLTVEPEEGGLSIDELLDWYWRMGFRGTADEIIRESSQ